MGLGCWLDGEGGYRQGEEWKGGKKTGGVERGGRGRGLENVTPCACHTDGRVEHKARSIYSVFK